MTEDLRPIKGYEGLYDITRSGRIISRRRNRALTREGDPYGFANVHLTDGSGERQLYRTFDLWEAAWPEADREKYKGK